MRRLPVLFDPKSLDDLEDIWQLIGSQDGAERANAVLARIETYCVSLGSMPRIGTGHDGRLLGLRTVSVRTVTKATVVFHVTTDVVTVLRISYLGKPVIEDLPSIDVENPIDVSQGAAS